MTAAEFKQTCEDVCPNCRAGVALRQRADTNEFVHDIYRGGAVTHSFCWASNFRNKYKDQLVG